MLIIRECRMRALILTELAKDAPELVAKKMTDPGNFKGATQRRCGSTAFRFPGQTLIDWATAKPFAFCWADLLYTRV